jgi:GNAT superfamily N-acetyltransferase
VCRASIQTAHLTSIGNEIQQVDRFISNLMTTVTQIRETTFCLRRAGIADVEFLLRLYAQQRTAELEIFGMDVIQRALFIQSQFRARQSSYAALYPTASDQIIELECGTAIGRFLVERLEDEIRLVDIALTPEQQGRGIGTNLIRALQVECEGRHRKLKLQVLKGTPAEKLYRRLGFVATGEDPFRRQMVWGNNLQHTQEDAASRQLC